MTEKKSNETDTEFLARTIAEGFVEVKTSFKDVNARLDVIDVRLDEVDDRLVSLEKGQAETHRRLDAIERKQSGLLESLDETVHQSDFRKLVERVEVLEKVEA